MASSLQVVERRKGPVTILDLHGRLVLDEGDDVLRDQVDALLRERRVDILLNFQNVTYIDSAGIGVVVAKYLSVRRLGGHLKLLHLSEHTRRVLTITKLLSVFDVFDSEEEAERSFPSVTVQMPASGSPDQNLHVTP